MSSPLEELRPRTLKQYGMSTERTVFQNFLDGWVRGDPWEKAIILHGPPGTGKTTLVRCAARTYKFELIDTNASTHRDREAINKLYQAALSASFSGNPRLIFLDEADNISKRYQRRIVDLVKSSKHPVVLAANDFGGISKALKSVCLELEFGKPSKQQLKKVTAKVGAKLGVSDVIAHKVAQRAESYREAVTMLHDPRSDPIRRPDDFRDRIEMVLQGEDVDIRPSEFWACAAWVMDNHPGTRGGEFDKWWSRYKEVGKPMEKYLQRALRARVKKVSFPWSIMVKGEDKPAKVEKKQKASVEEVEADPMQDWF